MFADHETQDIIRFNELSEKLQDVADKKDIGKIVGDTVDVKINGKLIKLQASIEKITEHLQRQDEALARLLPAEKATVWISTLWKVILGFGGLCIAIGGIMKLISIVLK